MSNKWEKKVENRGPLGQRVAQQEATFVTWDPGTNDIEYEDQPPPGPDLHTVIALRVRSAQEAADQIVGPGPYNEVLPPPQWNPQDPHQTLEGTDQDGGKWDVVVWGPY
jgi:hypothetical protein